MNIVHNIYNINITAVKSFMIFLWKYFHGYIIWISWVGLGFGPSDSYLVYIPYKIENWAWMASLKKLIFSWKLKSINNSILLLVCYLNHENLTIRI